jgi:hypothetical protein
LNQGIRSPAQVTREDPEGVIFCQERFEDRTVSTFYLITFVVTPIRELVRPVPPTYRLVSVDISIFARENREEAVVLAIFLIAYKSLLLSFRYTTIVDQ